MWGVKESAFQWAIDKLGYPIKSKKLCKFASETTLLRKSLYVNIKA